MAEDSPGTPVSTGQPAREAGTDLALADNIAQAVCAVPGVCKMSQGRFALAATYGPGGRVPGVVLWREASGKLLIEVHIVVGATFLLAALQHRQTRASAQPPVLLQLAEHVRLAVQYVVMEGNLSPHAIDVVMEEAC